MLPLNTALHDFPSDEVRQQFEKVFAGPSFVPTSPKIHELRARHGKTHAKILNSMEPKLDLSR
jgi:hypothetical protein